MANLDVETQKELTDGEEVVNLLQSKGWAVIKAKLDEKILDLQNINNLDEQNLAIDLKGRITATKLLFDWLKQDVYGYAEQQLANGQALKDQSEEGFIGRE